MSKFFYDILAFDTPRAHFFRSLFWYRFFSEREMFPLRSQMYMPALSEPKKNFEQTILPLIKKCYLKKRPQESYLVLLRLCLVPMYDRYAATLLYTYLFTVKKKYIYIYKRHTHYIPKTLQRKREINTKAKYLLAPYIFWLISSLNLN